MKESRNYMFLLLAIIFLVALFVSSCVKSKSTKVVAHVDDMQLIGSQLYYVDTSVSYSYTVDVVQQLREKEEILMRRDKDGYHLIPY